MTPLAHASTGYLIYTSLASTTRLDNIPLFLTSLVGATILDIDGLFGKLMKDHRNTLFHTPLFWLIVLVVSLATSHIILPAIRLYILAFFIGIFSHLFLDWFSGRTAGVRLLYPFSKKTFACFPIQPEKGLVSVLPNKHQKYFWKYYLENKFLIILEILIIASPILLTLIHPNS